MRTRLLLVPLYLALGAPAQCPTWGAFGSQGTLPTNLLPAGTCTEVSGVVASRHNPGVIWVHDDSGHGPQLVALRQNGALVQQYELAGVANRDWEDLALGPGPVAGRDWLYVADIGNNALGYTSFSLLRIPEPDVPSAPQATIPVAPEVFRFRYPSATHNAETLWIDPWDGAPYVLTKETGTTCYLYRYPLPLDAQVEKALVLEATLTAAPITFTGGAMSCDGRWIHARTYTALYAWRRPVGTSFASALAGAPCSVLNDLGKAEAIAVTPDGRGLIAISEGAGASIWKCSLTVPGGNAGWLAFGTGLGGGAGVPGLGLARAPILGQSAVAFGIWQAPASGAGALLVSLTAYPDGVMPLRGGWLHAAPDAVVFLTSDALGRVQLPLGVLPDDPLLRGLAVHAQTLWPDPTAPQGAGLSAGLTMLLAQ